MQSPPGEGLGCHFAAPCLGPSRSQVAMRCELIVTKACQSKQKADGEHTHGIFTVYIWVYMVLF